MTAFVLRATKRVRAGRACAILWLALLLLAGPNQTATAQSENALRWDNVATRAETLLNAERPTDTQLETLREDLSRQRGEALAVQGNARDRLSALEAQLNALGPAPSDGEVESAEIAARRDVLMTQIAGVKTPVLEAEESYLRADRLIDEIDSMLRARQSERMLRRGPSPANPVHWAAAGSQLAALSQKIRQSYAVMIAAEGGTILRQALPLAVLLFAVGIAILTIVRTRAVQLVARLLERSTRSSSRAGYSFVLNFVRIAIPAIAAIPIVVALFQITPEGVAMSAIRDGIIGGILFLIIAQWLAYSLFAPRALDTAVLPRGEGVARRGWRMTMLLARK